MEKSTRESILEGGKYRIPTEDEFVQGFRFQVKTTGRYEVIDIGTGKVESGEDHHFWTDTSVWWKKEPGWITVKDSDYTFTYNQAMDNFFEPFNVKSFLEQRLIRVKV